MIVRILGIIVGLFFLMASVLMIYIGQDEIVAQISIFLVGLLFAVYGIIGPKRMGRFLPATVKEIGSETIHSKSNGEKD